MKTNRRTRKNENVEKYVYVYLKQGKQKNFGNIELINVLINFKNSHTSDT